MTNSVQLLGSYWTLAVGADPLGEQRCFHDFRLRVETAAKAGFTAMGFWHADIIEVRKKYSFREMKQILDDYYASRGRMAAGLVLHRRAPGGFGSDPRAAT